MKTNTSILLLGATLTILTVFAIGCSKEFAGVDAINMFSAKTDETELTDKSSLSEVSESLLSWYQQVLTEKYKYNGEFIINEQEIVTSPKFKFFAAYITLENGESHHILIRYHDFSEQAKQKKYVYKTLSGKAFSTDMELTGAICSGNCACRITTDDSGNITGCGCSPQYPIGGCRYEKL